MRLSKSLSGRKRGSVWWEFFLYDDGCDKSTCLVVDETNKVASGAKVANQKHKQLCGSFEAISQAGTRELHEQRRGEGD